MPVKLLALAIASLMSLPASLPAQSLGDIAKQESERRRTVKPAARVLTNKDLPVMPSSPTDAGGADAGAAGDSAGAAPAVDGSAAGSAANQAIAAGDHATNKPEASSDKDERYWSGRMKALRDDLARDRILAEALQSRINALTTDFVNRDDPAQRSVIAQERQDAIDELARVQKSIVTRGRAIADLEEEARRAGVPAGWLRE